jgi:hypothetical protein
MREAVAEEERAQIEDENDLAMPVSESTPAVHIEQNDLFLDVTASCVPHDLMKAFQCGPALNIGL